MEVIGSDIDSKSDQVLLTPNFNQVFFLSHSNCNHTWRSNKFVALSLYCTGFAVLYIASLHQLSTLQFIHLISTLHQPFTLLYSLILFHLFPNTIDSILTLNLCITFVSYIILYPFLILFHFFANNIVRYCYNSSIADTSFHGSVVHMTDKELKLETKTFLDKKKPLSPYPQLYLTPCTVISSQQIWDKRFWLRIAVSIVSCRGTLLEKERHTILPFKTVCSNIDVKVQKYTASGCQAPKTLPGRPECESCTCL